MKPADKNRNLNQAKAAKNDEFYTDLRVIERELHHYKAHFAGKTVLCNCDDPRISNFLKFFFYQFKNYKLKRLLTTCWRNQNPDVFSSGKCDKAVYLKYTGAPNIKTHKSVKWHPLTGDGDFRSTECVEFLRQADIVVTNPPFSQFREYVAQLVELDKKFLIIGNPSAVTYKEIFKLIKANKIWLGYKPMGADMLFDVPKEFAKKLVTTKKEGSGYKIIDGVIKGRSMAIWYTNLPHTRCNEQTRLVKKYDPAKYPKYDNYDAIEVSKVHEIPVDYDGVMGVPISFMDKYNQEQFEIIGFDYEIKQGLLPGLVNSTWAGKLDRGYINGKRLYSRLLIKHKRPES